MTTRIWLGSLVAALCVGCGGSEGDEEFSDCTIGELTGTWRTHYTETDGSCGPIEDETGVFDPNAPPPTGCTYTAQSISSDKCRADLAFTCPTLDGAGTQSWTLVYKQISTGKLTGTGTVQLDHPTAGTCRSTYDLTTTKL